MTANQKLVLGALQGALIYHASIPANMASVADDQSSPDKELIRALQRVILELHGCRSQHVESIHVNETYQGESIWRGVVEIFHVSGHARADRCYAWIQSLRPIAEEVRFFAVLGSSAVKSGLDAVKYAHMVTNAPLINEFSKSAASRPNPGA